MKCLNGAPKTNRTSDLPLRRGLLYPLSYRGVARILPNGAWINEPREHRWRAVGLSCGQGECMFKMIMGGLAVLLLVASAAFWMLRPGTQRTEGSAAPDFALPD